ncbi:hypothetical protein B6V74_13040 [Thioclava sp. F42-5]|nr:hypothetical protein B6V74_13040 [Thioclava sp. F42-5]
MARQMRINVLLLLGFNGARGRNRTTDTRIFNQQVDLEFDLSPIGGMKNFPFINMHMMRLQLLQATAGHVKKTHGMAAKM